MNYLAQFLHIVPTIASTETALEDVNEHLSSVALGKGPLRQPLKDLLAIRGGAPHACRITFHSPLNANLFLCCQSNLP